METCPLITRRLSRSPHVRHVIRGCFQKPEDTEVLLASDWCLQRYSHESLTELSSPQDFPDGIMELHTFRWCEQLCHEPPLQQGGKDETSEDASPTKYMGQDLVVMLTRTSRLWLLAWCNDRFEKVWEWPFRYTTALKKAMDASAYKDSVGDIVSCFPGFPYLAVNIKTNNLCKLHLVCPTMDGTPDGSQSSPLPDQEIELFPGDTAHVLVASKSCSSPDKWNLILRMAPTKALYWSMFEFSEWTLTEKVEDATRDRVSFALPLPAPALQLLVLPPDRKCSKMYVLLVAPAYCGVCCVPNSGLRLKTLIVSLNGFMAGQPFTDWKMQLDWQGLACDCLRNDTLGWVTCSFRQPGGLRFSSFFLEMSTDPVWTAASETSAILQALPEKNDSDSQAAHKILMTLSGWFLFAPYMGDPVLVSPFADSAKALGHIAMASKRALQLGAQQYVTASDSAEPDSAKSAGQSRGFDESVNGVSAEEMELIRGWFEGCYTPGSSSEALHEGLMRLTNSRYRMAFFHGRLYLKLHLGVHVKDFVVLKNGGAPEAVGISGHGSEGALQFIPTSLKTQPSLVSEPVQLPPVTAMWSLTRSRTEIEHALVILSFVDASRALTAGHVMEDVSDAVGIITDEPTVACGQVADGWIVQITPNRALCCSLDFEMESDTGIERAAMSGIMAELQSLNMRDAETEGGQLPPAPAPSTPPALHVETSAETQRPEPCWVPSTGGHISAGACAEDLVAVCQDKTLTFLSCVDAFSPVKRKRSQEGAFVLQPLMTLGLKAAASHIAMQRLSPDSSQSMLPRYLVIVSLHDSSIQMMEVRPDVASYRTVGILHHGQLLGSTDPSSPRSIDDVNPDLPPAESVSIVQVTPQEVDLLIAWREGDVTHHRTGLPDVDFHTVDLFDLGDCVPTVQAVNESEKLYLAAGSNLMCNSYIYLLKFNSISRRFVKQTLVLPDTRLAAPILLPPQLGMHELLLVCISKTENMTCRSMRRQNSTESAFGGVEIQSRPLGETPTHIAALDWVGAVAVITIPRPATSVSDFFKSRCGKLLICTECGRGRKMSFALKGHLKVVAMTVWDPSYPAGNGSELQGAPKKKWLVIAMGAKIGNWRSEILILEIWREGKKIQVRSRGEVPVRDGVRSMAILRDEDDRERLAIATAESQRLLVMMPDPASGVPWEFPPLVEPFGSNITLHPGQIGTVGLAVTLDNGAVMHFVSADEATATEADLEEPTPAQMQNVLHMTSVSDKNSPISACLNLSAGCDSHEGRLASRRANFLTGDLKGNLCLWGTREPAFFDRLPFKPDENFVRWFGVAETRKIVRIQGQLGSEITAIHGVPQDLDGEEEDTSKSHVVVATSDGQFYLVSSMEAECFPASLLRTLQLVMLRDQSKSGFHSTALQDITEMYCERERKEIIGSPTSASRNPAISRGPAPVLDGDLLHGFMTLSEDKQKELEVEMSSMHKASPFDDVVDILRQSSLDESSSSTFVV